MLILVTEEVFHELISWLNAVAPVNIPCIVVTLLTSHNDKSSLKEAPAPENIFCMFVILLTSQSVTCPYSTRATVG